MSNNFSYLLSPGRLGSLRLKNRIIMPAIHLGMAQKGEMDERVLDFYETRAKGGTAMMVIGVCNTQPDFHNRALDLSQDHYLTKMEELVQRIHSHDCLCVAQLTPITYYGAPKRRVPSLEEIPNVVNQMVNAAIRAKNAGFDGVEYLAAGGSILSYFLSSAYNPGLSGYSGDLNNRMRLALEVIKAARAGLGAEYPLFIRIHGHEFLQDGYGVKEAVIIARAMVKAGITAINVTAGGFGTKIPQITTQVPPGTYSFLAREIKHNVNVPIMVGNRICDPSTAESVLRWSKVDFICLGRALVADPNLPKKVMSGRTEEIMPCIACCRCMDRTLLQQSMICTVNPRIGRETRNIQPANQKRTVTIVGGGPSGLQTASILRRRGHNVILHEADKKLGGAIRLAGLSSGKEDMRRFVNALAFQAQNLGVKIRLRSPVFPEKIKDIIHKDEADVLIVAAGGIPRQPDIPTENGGCVIQATDVLSGRIQPGSKVVIIGGGGVACETALFIARMGALSGEQALFLLTWESLPVQEVMALTRSFFQVTMVTRGPTLARSIGRSMRAYVKREIEYLGINHIPNTVCKSVNTKNVIISNNKTQAIPADTVILACGFESESVLKKTVQSLGIEAYEVGSASRSGNLLQAIYQATAIALKI